MSVSKIILNQLQVRTRLCIRRPLLKILLGKITDRFIQRNNQPYLALLYQAVMVVGYFRLMRVGEMTASEGEHALKFKDISFGHNKKKVVIVL